MQKNTNDITSDDVKKTYAFYAPIYDYLFGAVLEPGRRELCKEVAELKPISILEIGVGTGLLLGMYPKESSVSGIDISEEMLSIARARVKKMQCSNIHLETMDAEHLNFPDNSFDCVVLPYVLSVTPNPDGLIKEARRVCNKNGTLIILNHFSGNNAWLLLEKLFKNLTEKIGFRSEFSYENHILKHNWKVKKVTKVNLFGLSKLIVIENL